MDDKPALNELPALLAAELDSIGPALNSVSRAIISSILDDAVARATVAEALAYERLENMLFAEQRGDDAEIERDEAVARADDAENATKQTQAELEELKVLFHAVSLELTIVGNWTRRLLHAVNDSPAAGDTIEFLVEKLKTHVGYNYDEAPSNTEIQNRWMNELSAAAARAEVAEAERELWRQRYNSLYARFDTMREELAETLENIICALGLNPVDFSDELTEPLITGVIGAMQQRVAELEAAHRWRSVAEEPSAPGYYLAILCDWIRPCEVAEWEGPGILGKNGWTSTIRDRVVAWQALPDAPQEPQ